MKQSLTWRQAHAWRMAQQGLTARLPRAEYAAAVTRAGGIQAQVMSAAELALGARVDGLTPGDVQAALWQDRTLVKTWAMRGTLHLIAAGDLPLYVAARSFHDGRNWVGYFAYYGVPQAQYEALLAAIPEALGSEPLTREQLATAVAERVGAPELRDLMLASSWGSPMKPSAFRGDLCFGPSQGTNVTFVRPSAWLGPQAPVEPFAALQEVARRYLRAYGPATPEDFARWWEGGAGLALARKLFRSLGDELAAVDVEGWPAFALRDTLEPMQAATTAGCVRLLPMFDAYTLGVGRNMDALVDAAYKSRVYRPQGWISAVVLVDGRMEGVWEYKLRPAGATVQIRMFAAPAATAVRTGLEAEAERLAAFWNTEVTLEYADP
jgi:hypothetical protein